MQNCMYGVPKYMYNGSKNAKLARPSCRLRPRNGGLLQIALYGSSDKNLIRMRLCSFLIFFIFVTCYLCYLIFIATCEKASLLKYFQHRNKNT